jgi:hypothetical protein
MSIQPRGEPRSDGDRVLLGHPVRRRGVGQVRDPAKQRLALAFRLGLLGLGPVEFLAELPQFLDLLRAGRGAPGRALLGGAQRLGALGQLAPPLVGGEQFVKVSGGAAAGQRCPVPVRLVARGPQVNHLGESSGHRSLDSRVTRDSMLVA